ncbi:unnamed protein product [Closterium sp. NIES-53]
MGHNRDHVSTLCFPSSSATCSTIGVVLLVLYFVSLGPSLRSPISSPSFDAKELHRKTEVSHPLVRVKELGAELSDPANPEETWQQNQQDQPSHQDEQNEQNQQNEHQQKKRDKRPQPGWETQEQQQKQEQELLAKTRGKGELGNLRSSIESTRDTRTETRGPTNENDDARNSRGSSSRKGGSIESEACEGRKVYVYELPSRLNRVLLDDCLDTNIKGFCGTSRHGGLGTRLPPWNDAFEGKEPSSRAVSSSSSSGSHSSSHSSQSSRRSSKVKADGSRRLLSINRSSSNSSSGNGNHGSSHCGEGWRNQWYATENFNLALIFHSRLLQHPCRTSDPDSADLLFIPAYLGWMIWSLVEHGLFVKRDEPVADLERFLLDNADFKRLVNRGDHVLVLGRPIWDFIRVLDKPQGWGTDLWWRPTFNNVTLLTVEAPLEWLEREVFSVPYTTCFHPVGSADLEGWVRHVRKQPRPYLYSFVGGKRAHATWEGSLRGVLLNECENDPKRCIFLECTVADAEAATAAAMEIGRQAQKRKEEGKEEENEIEPDFPLRGCMDPRRVAGVMLQSEFCLQPLGDSLTRRSFFDSIISGCIPVVFTEGTFDLQYFWFFASGPEARRNVSVMVDSDDVIGRKVRIGEVLGGISEERKREMREELYKHIPRLLLRDHTRESEVGEEEKFLDMVDMTIEGLIERKKMRRAGTAGNNFP